MKQYIQAGAPLELLTKDELSDALGHKFDAFIRDFYRGKSYIVRRSPNNGIPSGAVILDGPEAGYAWSVKLVSIQHTGAAGPVSVYAGNVNDIINLPPIGNTTSIVNANTVAEAVLTWSSNMVVIKDETPLSVLPPSGLRVISWLMMAEQVPAEMVGKL